MNSKLAQEKTKTLRSWIPHHRILDGPGPSQLQAKEPLLVVPRLPVRQWQLELRPMLHDQEHVADCCCDIGNRFDVQYYHAGEPQQNPQGKPSSTGSGIEGLTVVPQVSKNKYTDLKSKSYTSYDHNPTPFHPECCIEGKA